MAACSKCSEDVPAEASFCPHCGTRFDTPKSVPPPASASAAVGPVAADPFSHTMPADPGELARLSDMIAAQRSKAPLPPPAPVPVRERQFGRTKALEAVEDRRTEPPAEQQQGDRVTRERTMASPQIPAPRPPPAPPQVAVPTPAAGVRVSPISPKAATTAQPAVHIVGAAVRVIWTDGQSYAATIVQVTPTHCSVRFANGSLQWIEHAKVFPG